MRVGDIQQFRPQGGYFMSKRDTDQKPGLPLKQIDRIQASFDGSDFVSFVAKPFGYLNSAPVMFPWDVCLFLAKLEGCD